MVYTVGFLTQYISSLFTADLRLSAVSVSGEVSNVTYHRSGHIYFTLKDADAQISAVMFRSDREGLMFEMASGDRVVVTGQVRVYEKGGSYQLYAKTIEPAGQGELYRRFLELKDRLEEQGMFDPFYKLPIPTYAKTIGIVTAPTGAAVRDIIQISRRRNPFVQLILYPALVQGEGAVSSIVRGIEALDQLGVDVMIVGRGGGSMEDLWAFNEEAVAKAIFATMTPVISAVGHETDTTIADFVADRRAATPSEAAELAVYDIRQLVQKLTEYEQALHAGIDDKVFRIRREWEDARRRLTILRPDQQLKQRRMRLIEIEERLDNAMRESVNHNRQRISTIAAHLAGLSPAARLVQGYAHLTDQDGKTIRSTTNLSKGDMVHARLHEGAIEAKVVKLIP